MQVLHAYYDTQHAPITFDYSNFLACAEGYRQVVGASSIHLHIVAAGFRLSSKRDKTYSDEQKRWRVNHILMRLPTLMPSVSDITLHGEKLSSVSLPCYPLAYPPRPGEKGFSFPYMVKNVNKFYGHGLDVQPYRATDFAHTLVRHITEARPYYTISLRTTQFETARNSNLEEWYRVYKDLTQRGFAVYVMPDFEDTMSNRVAFGYDWNVLEFTTHELDLRLAIYEKAIDNLCVNNGISTVMAYSKAPMKMFKIETPGAITTTAEFLMNNCGVGPGESPPYFQPNQKWVWRDDTAENILSTLGF